MQNAIKSVQWHCQCCSANNCSESDSGHELDTGGRRQLQSCKVMQSNDTKCIMQINANWCMPMQASQCNARGTTTRGRRQMRDNVKGADICLGRIQRQITFQYYARLAWWYYMVLCRGLNVSLSFNIQSAVSCPPILWQAKVAITCSLPIDHQCQTKLMDY